MFKGIKPTTIGIIGAGTMGSQIASLFSFIGHRVAVFDSAPPPNFIQTVSRWQRFLGRDEKLRSLKFKTDSTCTLVANLNELTSSTIIIECIVEDFAKKIAVLKQIEGLISSDTVLATNTSSLSILEMASALSRTNRLVGLHFFNPVHAIPLVEMCILPDIQTHVASMLRNLLEGLGRIVVECPDIPGFIVNHLLFLMIASAIHMVEENNVTPEAIDVAMKAGTKIPMGPLEIADLIGLDVCLMILQSLYLRTGNPGYAPPRRLEEMVARGHLGKKTKRGFFSKGD